MTSKHRLLSGVSCCGALLAAARVSYAQEPSSEAGPAVGSPLRYVVELYGYLPWSVEADVGVREQRLEFEADAGDVLDKLEAGGAGRLELWTGKLGLVFDAEFLQLGKDGMTGLGAPFDARVRTFTADVMLAGGAPLGGVDRDRARAMVELGAGARIETRDARLELADLVFDDDDQTVKVVGFVHVPVRVADRVWLRGRGTVAVPEGLSVSVLALAEYDFDPIALGLGYRFDKLEASGEHVAIDSRAHSAYVSLTMHVGG